MLHSLHRCSAGSSGVALFSNDRGSVTVPSKCSARKASRRSWRGRWLRPCSWRGAGGRPSKEKRAIESIEVYIYIYLLICERQGKKSGFWEDLVFIWMFCFFSLLWGYSGPFYMVSTLRPVSSKSKGISPRGLGDCTFLNSSKA